MAEWFGTFDNVHVVGWYEGHPSSSDNSHLQHVHIGVWTIYANDAAAMDEIFAVMTGDDMSELFPVFGDKGEGVKRIQYQLDALGYYGGAKDGVYGAALALAVKNFRAAHNVDVVGDGKKVTGWMTTAIDADLRAKDAKPGPAGPVGPAGPPGTLPAGTVLTLDAHNATVTAVTPPQG